MSKSLFRRIGGFAAIATLVALHAPPALGVVYGTDDRMDVYEYQSRATEWAWRALQSNVALVSAADISCSGGTCVMVAAPTLGQYYDLCPDERFVSQPTHAFCSGSLVDHDLVLTAGHCVTDQDDCDRTAFVFGYRMLDAATPVTSFPEDDVFRCGRIVVRAEDGPIDFAVVKLDRSASPGHRPLPIRREDAVELDGRVAGLMLIGHPSGIPLKIGEGPMAIGASGLSGGGVRDAQPGWFQSNLDAFTHDLDTFGGSSGSAVVSVDERGDLRFVEGVLVRGSTDWIWDPGGSCYRRNVCEDETGCFGAWEEITRATVFAPAVPCACGDGRCDPTEDEFACPADCLGDLDGDGVEESQDNCPGLPNPGQDDGDGDRAGDPCDCEPTDPVLWETPGEARHVRFTRDDASGESAVGWFPPQDEGSTALYYDVLRSDVPFDFLGPAVCVESDDGADRVARDGDPPAGAAYYYLVRAQNDCPAGEGPLGSRSDGSVRVGVPCPPSAATGR